MATPHHMTLTMNPPLMDLLTPTAVLKAVVAPLSDIMTNLSTTLMLPGCLGWGWSIMTYPSIIVNTALNILLFLYEYDVGGGCFGVGIGGPLGEWAVNLVCWSG